MTWTALVPLKKGADRKTRLADRLTQAERLALSDAMAAHVLSCLAQVPAIARIVILSPDPVANFGWWRDEGRGLNSELNAYRAAHQDDPLLVIHGDLPLLRVADIAAFLVSAESAGAALAPDRHGVGTNALALFTPGLFTFAFGEDSKARHWAALAGRLHVMNCPGLSHDVDDADDLEAVQRIGSEVPSDLAPR